MELSHAKSNPTMHVQFFLTHYNLDIRLQVKYKIIVFPSLIIRFLICSASFRAVYKCSHVGSIVVVIKGFNSRKELKAAHVGKSALRDGDDVFNSDQAMSCTLVPY